MGGFLCVKRADFPAVPTVSGVCSLIPFPPHTPPPKSQWTMSSASWPSTPWRCTGEVQPWGAGRLRIEPGHLTLPSPGTEQSQPVAFPPSTEPAFVTVPQRGFGEPFVLNPGTWTLLVEAEGVLLVRQGPQQGGGRPWASGSSYSPPLSPRITWSYCRVPTMRQLSYSIE